ncbi:hypothetical protein FOS14_22650 [Skermania sp. ID1734]|uniref:hypothetical protein n=1 Tax=Skermania sp. ID1734 TaxID=2597516 RepID=UPI00117F3875|nr:hypothetical protein [Skermania sp. ID1734]TSD93657.1 hypothetical protein FOS14_22650 [Skermania sp. ID1734]
MWGRGTSSTAATAADRVVLAELAADAVTENRAAYRKVTACAGLWEAWIERDVQLGNGDFHDCGNNALAEIGLRLGCSRTIAENTAALGMDLRLRYPRLRAAFAAGELDQARVAAAAGRMCGFSLDTAPCRRGRWAARSTPS